MARDPENEIELMRNLQVRASERGARLFRQNTGSAWVGKVERGTGAMVRVGAGDVVIRNARPFHAGFTGMSDLGGWSPLSIEPDMIGMTVPLYTQAEVKFGRGRATEEQSRWISVVRRAGGRAGIVRSEEDLDRLLSMRPHSS